MFRYVVFIWGALFLSFVCAEDTQLKLYRPYGSVYDQVAPIVIKKLVGHCDKQSQVLLREDAWYCEAQGRVFDPCFLKETGAQRSLLCPESPWTSDSVEIEVLSSLDSTHHQPLDMSRTYPWAIELGNKEECLAVTTSTLFDSMPIRYRCSNTHILVGHLQRCNPQWSILEKTEEGVSEVLVRRAWF